MRRHVGHIRTQFACEMFVDQMGIEMLRKNLFQNFVLHISHLADLNLITSGAHLQIVLRLKRLMDSDKESKEVWNRAREQHKLYWKTPSQQQLLQITVDDVEGAKLPSSNQIIEDQSDAKGSCLSKPNGIEAGGCDGNPSTANQPVKSEPKPFNLRRMHSSTFSRHNFVFFLFSI